MSAAESEESRCPDFATASIRTQASRWTVAQRSSSAIEASPSPRASSFDGGCGSGTERKWLIGARLASAAQSGDEAELPIANASLSGARDGTAKPDRRKMRAGVGRVAERRREKQVREWCLGAAILNRWTSSAFAPQP